MKNLKIFMLLIGIILLIANIFALPVIKINAKSSFNVGETIQFDYTITPDRNQNIIFIPRIKCTGLVEEMLAPVTLDLIKGNPITKTYTGFNVTKDTNPQQCIAMVQVLRPFILISQEIFQIVNQPLINLDLKLCKDKECQKQSKVFIKGEKIYFDYNSDVNDLIISAKLTFPDGKTQIIAIPGSVDLKEEGSYKIEINAYKSGYRSLILSDEFAVISNKPIIKTITPIKEKAAEITKEMSKGNYFYWSIFIFIIAVLIIVIIFIIKKIKEKNRNI